MIPSLHAPRYLMIANALKSALFAIPVLVLYYNQKGVSTGDFFLIQGIAWLFVFALELPSGYIGDVFSRKYTIICGFFFWILGYFIWIFGFRFWCLLIGELIFAVAISLVSGTMEAYLYDLLKRNKKEKTFHKKLSKMKTLEGCGLLFSTFTGAFLFQYLGSNAPIWSSIACMFAGIMLLMYLPDVPESRRIVRKDKSKWQDILDICKYAIKHPQIKWLIFFPAVYGTLTIILMWGLQPVMILHALPVFIFGFVVGINAFMRTFFAFISGKIIEKFALNGTIKILIFILTLATVGACLSAYVPDIFVYVCLGLMILGSGSIVLANVVTSTLINHQIQSHERSTILSVKSMMGRALGGCAMILLKPLFDTVGVGETFLISGLLLVPIIYFSFKLYKLRITPTSA